MAVPPGGGITLVQHIVYLSGVVCALHSICTWLAELPTLNYHPTWTTQVGADQSGNRGSSGCVFNKKRRCYRWLEGKNEKTTSGQQFKSGSWQQR